MSWSIGKLNFKSHAVLAPMVGYTDLVYRQLVRRFGAELTYTEMVSSEAFIRKGRKTLELLKTSPADKPTGVQIMGSRPEVMAETVKHLQDMGFVLVDVNMGCPARKIVKQGAGSALLNDEGYFGKIIRSVVSNSSLPVTIKIRIGMLSHDEDKFVRLLKIAESEGVQAITIHGRTQKQRYKGTADLSPIRIAKETVKCPVIGNGDVTSGEKAIQMMQETGCDAVMVGRASIGRPWVFDEINCAIEGVSYTAPSFLEQLDIMISQMDGMARQHGEKLGLLKMRKIGAFYFKNCLNVNDFRKRIVRASTREEFLSATEDLKKQQLDS